MKSIKKTIDIYLLILKERLVPSFFYSFLQRIKNYFILPRLDKDFKKLSLAEHCLWKLLNDYDFKSILDVGAGACEHSILMNKFGKEVTALDLGKQKISNLKNINLICMNFLDYKPKKKYDALWASHVFEHIPDCSQFIKKIIRVVKPGGIIAITIPPPSSIIVGGHLNNFNAGYLLYHLVLNGINCRNCSILRDRYNISVIVKNLKAPLPKNLTMDNGDITRLRKYLPSFISEPFDGNINRWNW